MPKLIDTRSGFVLAGDVILCENYQARLKGMLGLKSPPLQQVYLFKPCRWIHTFGMKFPISAAFLDQENTVIRVIRKLSPNRIAPLIWKARSVLEYSPLSNLDLNVGTNLRLLFD